MNASQLCHEGSPHAFTTLFGEFCPDAEFFAHGQVLSAPGADMHKDRQEGDAFFRETVDDLLFVPRVVGPGEDPLSERHFQTICEGVGRDALLGLEHLTEAPFTAKDHVAEDQEGPTVAEDFEREIDRAKGSGGFRSLETATSCIIASVWL
jgi:hypothetical protein